MTSRNGLNLIAPSESFLLASNSLFAAFSAASRYSVNIFLSAVIRLPALSCDDETTDVFDTTHRGAHRALLIRPRLQFATISGLLHRLDGVATCHLGQASGRLVAGCAME